ncbi:hypothetical protein TNCV_3438291 [Trichonephila clavipes]|nr:hypothetical protein TNCV_3438291 [Trichonephila clavipes]
MKSIQAQTLRGERKRTPEGNLSVLPLKTPMSAVRQDSSSKPETDESHLVRDQGFADGVGAHIQELQYVFAMPSPSVVSHCHPTTER